MTLEQRVQRLEDIEAIKQLKADYCAACDDDYEPDVLAELFCEDAVWDGHAFGRYEGRQAIRDFFAGASKMLTFASHNVMNPVIQVDGDRALGRWYLIQPCTTGDNQALWLCATYRDQYRREPDRWRFQHVDIEIRFLSPHEDGWAKTPFLEL